VAVKVEDVEAGGVYGGGVGCVFEGLWGVARVVVREVPAKVVDTERVSMVSLHPRAAT
jgi:hypothetical protein